MKKILLILVLAISANAWALEKEVSSSFENTWSKVLLLMSAEGTKILFIDKSSGLLRASLPIDRRDVYTYYYQCRPPGTVASITSTISVVVQEVSNNRSKIIITSYWEIESYRYKKLFGIPFIKTKRVIYYTSCVSNDRLERNLLKKLSLA